MAFRVRIDTLQDAQKFSRLASQVKGDVTITDRKGLRINGKSVLGVLHATEFSELWCESEEPIEGKMIDFIV